MSDPHRISDASISRSGKITTQILSPWPRFWRSINALPVVRDLPQDISNKTHLVVALEPGPTVGPEPGQPTNPLFLMKNNRLQQIEALNDIL